MAGLEFPEMDVVSATGPLADAAKGKAADKIMAATTASIGLFIMQFPLFVLNTAGNLIAEPIMNGCGKEAPGLRNNDDSMPNRWALLR